MAKVNNSAQQEKIGEHTLQEWRREIQKQLQLMQKFARTDRKNDIINRYDYSDPMSKRRAEAMLNTIKAAYDRYSEQYSEIFCGEYSLGNEWLELNTCLVNYESVNAQGFLLHGAAIWMLDRIKLRSGWKRELLPNLPKNDEFFADFNWPDIWDSQHNVDLIHSLAYVLYSRNSDISRTAEGADGPKVLTDVLTAEGKHHADVPSRRNFEAVMALIPTEDIEKAVRNFEESMWEWTDRYFRCVAPMQQKINTLNGELDSKEAELTAMLSERKEICKKLDAWFKEEEKSRRNPKAAGKAGKPNAVMMKKPGPEAWTSGTGMADYIRQPFQDASAERLFAFRNGPDMTRLQQVEEKMEALVHECEALDREIRITRGDKLEFATKLVRMGEVLGERCEERFGPEVAEELDAVRIRDPFEACFALLWLIDSGSDLPWLYGPGAGLAQEIGDSLPWGIIQYDEDYDEIWNPDDDDDDDWEECDEKPAKKPAKAPDIPDWYERKYHHKKFRDFTRSLAQMLYEETGCLMPRNLHLYDCKAQVLGEFGLRGKDAVMLLTCMNALGYARRTGEALNFDDSYMAYLRDGVYASQDSEAGEAKTDGSLADRIEAVQNENKRLKSALYEAERNGREARKELETAKKAAALEHRELADLREMVFINEKLDESADDSEPDVAFPYEVRKETLVFGGHDTWSKAIRAMLTGNVRFISRDLIFDVGIVRNADIIWIQANAISHTQYYRVVDAARLYKKQVRYFTSAGVQKCAVQLYESDMI